MMFNLLVVLVLIALMKVSSFTSISSSVTQRYHNANSIVMISHGIKFKRLSRPADARKALLRGLTTEVIRHGRIRTTLVRAKEMKRFVDHIITLAKKGSLHHRRQALAYIYDKDLVAALFEQAPERYADRQGGYCRVIKEDLPRRGDSAVMAVIELV